MLKVIGTNLKGTPDSKPGVIRPPVGVDPRSKYVIASPVRERRHDTVVGAISPLIYLEFGDPGVLLRGNSMGFTFP